MHVDGRSACDLNACAMTTNSAYSGGAINVMGHSTITATDCKMVSNLASWGGALSTWGNTMVFAVACQMTSNNVTGTGGAVFVTGQSSFTATDSTMDSNFALDEGGAVYIAPLHPEPSNTIVVLIGCLVSQNSAYSAGGLAAGNYSHGTIQNSHFVSNHGTSQGDDVLVHKDGLVELSNSVFESCGAGIVSLGGNVRCDAADCFLVCTQCPSPQLATTTSPTASPSSWARSRMDFTTVGLACGSLALLCVIMTSVILVRRHGSREFGATSAGAADSDQSLLLLSNVEFNRAESNQASGVNQTASAAVNLVHTEEDTKTAPGVEMTQLLPWAVMMTSPAAIFVVNQSLRVVLWSFGKKKSVRSSLIRFLYHVYRYL